MEKTGHKGFQLYPPLLSILVFVIHVFMGSHDVTFIRQKSSIQKKKKTKQKEKGTTLIVK